MAEPTRFLLMPGSWRDADQLLSAPLIGRREGKNAAIPWVAVGRPSPAGFDFVRADSAHAMEAIGEATKTQKQTQIRWEVSERSGLLFWKRPSLLTAHPVADEHSTARTMSLLGKRELKYGVTMSLVGAVVPDDYCCDELFTSAAFDEAGSMLASESLAVVAPKRGMLIVAAGSPGDVPVMEKMLAISSGVCSRAADMALSPAVFFVQQQKPVGFFAYDGADRAFLSLLRHDLDGWNLPSQ